MFFFFSLSLSLFFFFFFFFLVFLGLPPQHIDVPRLGDELELQLLGYATATAIPGPSQVCGLYHSSQQSQILNPLSKARDRTRIFMDTYQVYNPPSRNRNSLHSPVGDGLPFLQVEEKEVWLLTLLGFCFYSIRSEKKMTFPSVCV